MLMFHESEIEPLKEIILKIILSGFELKSPTIIIIFPAVKADDINFEISHACDIL